jgi:hypothetical protein
MTPSAQDKLGTLLRMLSSDKDGEVVAAASAIVRTLKAEGLDIHSFADALCRPAPRTDTEARSASREAAHDIDWYSVACEGDAHGDLLTPREQQFGSDMVTWTARRAPTKKQQAWLLAIFNRMRRRG